MKSSLSIISFMDYAFDVVSKSSLPYPMLCRFLPVSSSKSCIVLQFALWSMIHFELIFVRSIGLCLDFLFLPLDVQLFHHHLLKRLPLFCICSFVKDQLNLWVYFLGLYYVPLIYLSILLLIPHCLEYCNFMVSFDVKNWESSDLVLQYCVGYSGSLASLHKL